MLIEIKVDTVTDTLKVIEHTDILINQYNREEKVLFNIDFTDYTKTKLIADYPGSKQKTLDIPYDITLYFEMLLRTLSRQINIEDFVLRILTTITKAYRYKITQTKFNWNNYVQVRRLLLTVLLNHPKIILLYNYLPKGGFLELGDLANNNSNYTIIPTCILRSAQNPRQMLSVCKYTYSLAGKYPLTSLSLKNITLASSRIGTDAVKLLFDEVLNTSLENTDELVDISRLINSYKQLVNYGLQPKKIVNTILRQYGVNNIVVDTECTYNSMAVELPNSYLAGISRFLLSYKDYIKAQDDLECLGSGRFPKYPTNLEQSEKQLNEYYRKRKENKPNRQIPLIVTSKLEAIVRGYVFIGAKETDELKHEGRELDHCVYSYQDEAVEGITNIMFMRHKMRPQQPLITIEVSNNDKVLQAYGYENRELDDEELTVIEEWAEICGLELNI